VFLDGIVGAALVEDPDGGVLLVGGLRDNDKVLDSILKLSSSSDDEWEKLPAKLSQPRFGHVAFMVPNIANCKKV